MPKMTDIVLLQLGEQPTLSIRTRTQVEKLPVLIGESYGRIASYMQGLGESFSDVPFVAYHNMDMQDLDVEMGFPVAKPLPDNEDIHFSVIPARKVVFCMYRGAYSGMAPAYEEMAKWIEDNGFTALGTSYEYYYNGPECPESELLTKIVMPLKE
jgi:effector-binding domain-containing protein